MRSVPWGIFRILSLSAQHKYQSHGMLFVPQRVNQVVVFKNSSTSLKRTTLIDADGLARMLTRELYAASTQWLESVSWKLCSVSQLCQGGPELTSSFRCECWETDAVESQMGYQSRLRFMTRQNMTVQTLVLSAIPSGHKWITQNIWTERVVFHPTAEQHHTELLSSDSAAKFSQNVLLFCATLSLLIMV